MYDGFIGSIVPWAGNFAPEGWFFCNGQTVSIQQYTALYAVIGIRYGGDGKTNFQLPDLQQAFPIGVDTRANSPMPITLAKKGGNSSGQMTVAPYHNHTFSGTVTAALTASTTGGTLAGPAPANAVGQLQRIAPTGTLQIPMYATTLTGTASDIGQLAVTAPTVPAVTGSTGSATALPFATLPPYQVLNYLICWNGVYPVQS